MRTITAVLLALFGIALTGVSADAGAWCANYTRGVSNCGYSSAAMLGHRARPRQWLLRPEPLPGDGLRHGRKLECPQPVEERSARLLGRPRTHKSSSVSAAC
jgi:hypothetical protein